MLAEVLGTELIRLQCYEGLDAMSALYEWNYPRQMLHARLSEADGSSLDEREAYMFSERFLLKRPLLEAITRERSPVLLIDEVDRADEAFEAFLLEVLAEWQVTIPELGTIRARHKPHVIVTSNRTRELSDALRRRCLFLWLPYPSLAQEIEILHARVPGLSDRLARQIALLMQALRELPLQKAPGVAESLDWALALMSLHRDHLDARTLEQTLGCVLKVHEDRGVMTSISAALDPILGDASANPRVRRLQPRHRLRVRFRVGAAQLMYPSPACRRISPHSARRCAASTAFSIGPGELHDAARALDVVDLANERAVRHALRPILGGTLDDVTVFDAAFTRVLLSGPRRCFVGIGAVRANEAGDRRRRPRPSRHRSARARHRLDADSDEASGAGRRSDRSARDRPPTARRGRACSRIELQPARRPTRRTRPSCRASIGLARRRAIVRSPAAPRPVAPLAAGAPGRRFDLRRTLRAEPADRREPLSPRWLRRPRRAPRIVLLVDGSRSMSAYARTSLQIAVALAAPRRGRGLHLLDRAAARDRRRAAGGGGRSAVSNACAMPGPAAPASAPAFATSCGASASALVGRDTLVMIVSDGLDVGAPDMLRDAMRRTAAALGRRRVAEPAARDEQGTSRPPRGMRAARPYITTFASVTDQAGLRRLSRVMRLRP